MLAQRRNSLRRKLRRGGCLTALVIAAVVVAVIVLLALIARDPTGTAEGVSHWWGQVGDIARAILRAPLDFFRALLTFVEGLFH
jgi:hypothetical protein